MTRKLTIQLFKDIATSRGGKCLSKVYINGRTPLEWECKFGHRWKAVPESIRGTRSRSGTWCGRCSSNNPGTLIKLKEFALSKNGKCLESKYLGARVPHKWVCSYGHTWNASPDNILNKGRWCPECASKKKLTIELMQSWAIERGGRCLSTTYKSNGSVLEWECGNKHSWKASASSIKNGSWCPECALGIGERLTRAFFEQIFGVKFPKYKKFDWLRNSSGNKMEIDGFNESLGIGFEHQGAHHFKIVKPFITTKTQLMRRMLEDELKLKLCKEHGIKLIIVPEINHLLKLSELKPFLLKEFKRLRIEIPEGFDNLEINIKEAYSRDYVSEMKALARKNAGKFVSVEYSGNLDPHIWECSKGHKFHTSPAAIKAGRWCRFCAGNVTKTIEELSEFIQNKGGRCLSSKYKNAHTKVKVECGKGHTWDAIPRLIFRGHWCPYCVGQKGTTIQLFKDIAKSHGGECLSSKYTNAHSKLRFKCANGHRWAATANSIRRGSWCSKCHKMKIKTNT